ncbi:hypothetical protein MFUM_700103 [Methylacidiphilum fumariolicum SolV]|jgi:hypothetical protein|uniref:Uncharacterized protein n=2 Tax=Candidatus Methylacidiphilum fumarolicum TaxID=591154 RepID=I0JZ83_METFB|nr:conserved protein of unknown function [Candidatus Methylacidiphilum fumarolicum]CCG92552.1 hypothetical protein MFUM_700103 [Methylacidiphilum fumariolicum SolV]
MSYADRVSAYHLKKKIGDRENMPVEAAGTAACDAFEEVYP